MSRPITLVAGLLLLGFTLYYHNAISAQDAPPVKGQKNQKDDGQKNQKDDGQKNQNDGNSTDKKIAELKTQPDRKNAELKTQPGKAPLKREGILKAVPVNNNQNNNKDDGQHNQNDDGQKNQKDDGQQNQKGNGNGNKQQK